MPNGKCQIANGRGHFSIADMISILGRSVVGFTQAHFNYKREKKWNQTKLDFRLAGLIAAGTEPMRKKGL